MARQIRFKQILILPLNSVESVALTIFAAIRFIEKLISVIFVF